MLIADLSGLLVEQLALPSQFLKRQVVVDVYLPKNISRPEDLALLLLNDGQDLEDMDYATMVESRIEAGTLRPFVTAGIHANKYRKSEYGTAGEPDFAGRGERAEAHSRFVCEELLPFLQRKYGLAGFREIAYGGFSLGGLSAIDTVWKHPQLFSTAAVFSGSLWWRSHDLGAGYDDHLHRIIHAIVRKGRFHPGLRFYFTTGSLDETADRNGNGIIDSIDDTLDLIRELKEKGYTDTDIRYVNFEDGRHDVPTWGRAMPEFLEWVFGISNNEQGIANIETVGNKEGAKAEVRSVGTGESC